MLARVLLPLALVFGALVGIGVVYPTLNGPFRVDCGQLDDATCEQIWREVANDQKGPTSLLPVTRVRVNASTADDPASWCGTVYIEQWIFSTSVSNECARSRLGP